MQKRALMALLAAALAIAATACSNEGGAGLPPPPPGFPGAPQGGSDETFSGKPAKLQIVVPATVAYRWPRLLPVAKASNSLEAVIRMANYSGGFQIYEEFVHRPYDPTESILVEMDVVGQRGYEVSAVIHGSGLKAVGLVQGIDVGDGETVPVVVQVEEPSYSLSVPSVVYGGGSVNQLHVYSNHPMYGPGNVAVLIGIEPWDVNGIDGLWSRPGNNPNNGGFGAVISGSGGVAGSKTFPHVESNTLLYWQVRVCTNPMYADGQTYCYYDPDVEAGAPLETTTLAAGRP